MVHTILLLISVFSFLNFLDLACMETPFSPVKPSRTLKNKTTVAHNPVPLCSTPVEPELAKYYKKYPEIITEQRDNKKCLREYLETEIFPINFETIILNHDYETYKNTFYRIRAVMKSLLPHTRHLVSLTPTEKNERRIQYLLDRVERKRAFDIALANLLLEKRRREQEKKRACVDTLKHPRKLLPIFKYF